MFCNAVGNLPVELTESNNDWFWLTVEWIKRYLEYACDQPPYYDCYVGASEETEVAEMTDEVLPNDEEGRIPKAISVFYDDGAYQEYEPYYEKCVSAYSKLMANVQWDQLNPDILKKYFSHNQYSLIKTPPKELLKQDDIDKNLPTKINQDYEVIGLLPPSVIKKSSEWSYFVIKLFMDYWRLFLSDTESHSICIHHVFYEGWIRRNDYQTWKMPEGIGLRWKIREEETYRNLLEISRLIWAHFLVSFNWALLHIEEAI